MTPIVKIRLIGDNPGELDVKDQTSFPVIMAASDVRNLSEKKGAITRTITLAPTANNAELLGHYYMINSQAGTFNQKKATPCIVVRNGVPIMDNAVFELTDIVIQENDSRDLVVIKYEAIIKDQTSDFFTKIGSAELTDIRLTQFNHEFNAANIIASFSHTVTDGYKYLLPLSDGNQLNINQFRPAIYAKQYFDRIFAAAGFSYEWDELEGNETRFDKWIIPYNGEAPRINKEESEFLTVVAEQMPDQEKEGNPNIGIFLGTDRENMIVATEIKDDSGSYNPTLTEFTSPIYTTAGGNVTFEFSFEYELFINNATAYDAELIKVAIINISAPQLRPYIAITNNGVTESEQTYGITTVNFNETYNPGETIIATGATSVTIGVLAQQSEIYIPAFGVATLAGAQSFKNWALIGAPGGTDADIRSGIRIRNLTMKITPSATEVAFGKMINISDFIPKKVKQAEFIKAIFTLNNLFATVDQFNDKKLILKSRDQFYNSGQVKDWSKKWCNDKEQRINFISSVASKRRIMTYSPDNDAANSEYTKATGEIYGQLEYVFESEHVTGTESNSILFSPTPVTTNSFGAVVPMINGVEPKNNIRLLYDGGVKSCGNYEVIDYVLPSGNVSTIVNDYPLLSHFDKEENPTFDLNFGVCDYYYYQIGSRTANNMFNMKWRRTFAQINSGLIVTGYVQLNEYDISQLRLNDRIYIIPNWYNINRLEFDGKSNGPAKVELITFDPEANGAFLDRNPVGSTGVDSLSSVRRQIAEAETRAVNLIQAPAMVAGINNIVNAPAMVIGSGNMISSPAMVIGDGITADRGGIYTPGITLSDGTTIESNPEGKTILSEVIISPTEILNLGSSPITVIANPGPGNYISVVKILAEYTFKTSSYTTTAATLIFEDAYYLNVDPLLITSGETVVTTIRAENPQNITTLNEPLTFTTSDGSNPTGGDGWLKIKAFYTIENYQSL